MAWVPNLLKYYVWLIDHIDHENFKNHDCLLSETWQVVYTNVSIPNDENRVADGLALRDLYMSELLVDLPDFGECRMLELLVGLSIRMNNSFYDWNQPDQAKIYFWEMMKNLQLIQYTDEYCIAYPKSSLNDILTAFRILNDRAYSKDGDGGLFPLSPDGSKRQDQRKVELWYQMMTYMTETD